MTLDEQLRHLIDTAKIRRTRYTEVLPTIEATLAELDRLREIEFQYESVSK